MTVTIAGSKGVSSENDAVERLKECLKMSAEGIPSEQDLETFSPPWELPRELPPTLSLVAYSIQLRQSNYCYHTAEAVPGSVKE
jgi:hypothetical protein